MTEPNPDWQSAPYEESGVVIADFLKDTIAEFMKRFDAMTIKIERDENPGLFRYNLKEGIDSSSNECDCSH